MPDNARWHGASLCALTTRHPSRAFLATVPWPRWPLEHAGGCRRAHHRPPWIQHAGSGDFLEPPGRLCLETQEAAQNWNKTTWVAKDAGETETIACFSRDVRAWTCLLTHLLAQRAIAWDVQFRCSVRLLAVARYSPNVASITPRPSMPGMVVFFCSGSGPSSLRPAKLCASWTLS